MDFNQTQPIYLQIAQYISEQIMSGEWEQGQRIPSVRELGAMLGVNPNTCIRAYDHLTRLEVISSSRGIGYSVVEGAPQKLKQLERDDFFEHTLPAIFEKMKSLGIQWHEVEQFYNERSQSF